MGNRSLVRQRTARGCRGFFKVFGIFLLTLFLESCVPPTKQDRLIPVAEGPIDAFALLLTHQFVIFSAEQYFKEYGRWPDSSESLNAYLKHFPDAKMPAQICDLKINPINESSISLTIATYRYAATSGTCEQPVVAQLTSLPPPGRCVELTKIELPSTMYGPPPEKKLVHPGSMHFAQGTPICLGEPTSAEVKEGQDANARALVYSPPDPGYPLDLRIMGIEGSVELSVDIDKDGNVTNATVVKATVPTVFDAAAINYAKQCKYMPSDKPTLDRHILVNYKLRH